MVIGVEVFHGGTGFNGFDGSYDISLLCRWLWGLLGICFRECFNFFERVARCDMLLAVPVIGLDFEAEDTFNFGGISGKANGLGEFGVCVQ